MNKDAKPIEPWPVGLSTGCFFDTSIFDVLELIRDEGFELIEICSFPKHLDYHDRDRVEAAAARIRELGLKPFSMHAPFAEHIDITALDAGRREVAMNEMLQACDAASILGVRHLVVHPGPEQEGSPPPEERYLRMENASHSLNRVAARCRELGISLLLENMLPHLLFGHTRDMLYMFGAIPDTSVGACLDTGHAYLSGDLATVVHKLSGHLRMIHANDNRGDWDAHLPPGQGHIDWESLTRHLRSYGFDGTIILELAGGGEQNRPEVVRRATAAREYLGRLATRMAEETTAKLEPEPSVGDSVQAHRREP